jgi:hypothetical protein
MIYVAKVGEGRPTSPAGGGVLKNGTFRYVDEWIGERSAVLEFEAVLDGLTINGVDIVRWNDDDRVTHFKVMVRPYKALTALMAHMAKLLETINAAT